MQGREFMETMEEHRTQRSNSPLLAAQYQLEQITHDFGLSCAIVANEQGELLFASDAYDLLFYKALAGVSKSLTSKNMSLPMWAKLHLHRKLDHQHLSSRLFLVDGMRYYLIAIGNEPLWREIGILRAIRGLQRILKREEKE